MARIKLLRIDFSEWGKILKGSFGSLKIVLTLIA